MGWPRHAEGTGQPAQHTSEGWRRGWTQPWGHWPRDADAAGAYWSQGQRQSADSLQNEGWDRTQSSGPWRCDEDGIEKQVQRKAAGRLFARALQAATKTEQHTKPEPTESVPVATASATWKACPRDDDIHSKMCNTGRVDPFDVGYACTFIPDHQPEGRAANQPLSRVWQSAKVLDHAPDKVVYIGHEQPLEVFRAKLPSGKEQLLTTEGWKLWILQKSALQRHPKKCIIAPKILMDEEIINQKIHEADIPDDVDTTYIKSDDGAKTYFSWRDSVARRKTN